MKREAKIIVVLHVIFLFALSKLERFLTIVFRHEPISTSTSACKRPYIPRHCTTIWFIAPILLPIVNLSTVWNCR